MSDPQATHVMERRSWPETKRILNLLRTESVGGILLLVATFLALLWANSGMADAYFGIRNTTFGPEIGPINLHLSIGQWAADGLLVVFFFMVGLELKQEFVAGDLRDPRRALVPIAAAFGGVAVPAVIYSIINWGNPETMRGWAIPTATDIAFAIAVLAVIGRSLPIAMRTFLLTLAIVDDLIAITIIAVFYTDELNITFLLLTFVPIIVFGIVANRAQQWFRGHLWASWLILLPIGIVAWALLLNSGVHATIAGVLLAFTIPVHEPGTKDAKTGLAHMLEHHIRPLSSGVCVPIFAFFSAGVAVGGLDGLRSSLTSPVALGVICGLVFGKIIGIFGTTFLITKLNKNAKLDPDLAWIDVVGLGAVAGIGFTVSLLVCELSFGLGSPLDDDGKVGILTASLLAAVVGSIILIPRNRHYAKLAVKDAEDLDADGVPDAFEESPPAEFVEKYSKDEDEDGVPDALQDR